MGGIRGKDTRTTLCYQVEVAGVRMRSSLVRIRISPHKELSEDIREDKITKSEQSIVSIQG